MPGSKSPIIIVLDEMSSHKFFLSTFAERRTSLLIGVGFVHVGKNGRGNVLAINFSLVSILFCYNFKKMGQNDQKTH